LHFKPLVFYQIDRCFQSDRAAAYDQDIARCQPTDQVFISAQDLLSGIDMFLFDSRQRNDHRLASCCHYGDIRIIFIDIILIDEGVRQRFHSGFRKLFLHRMDVISYRFFIRYP
jgi:hypothetical protein